MSLDAKLLNVGLVLIVFLPIAGLFLYRWRRGEVRFHGFWVTPREFRAREEAERRKKGGEPPTRGERG